MLFLAFVLAFGVQASAQTPPAAQAPAKSSAPPEQGAATPATRVALPTDYSVGPQDVLNIVVFGEPQLSGHARVDGDGTIPFQYLQRVKVENLTVVEVAEVLRKGLADGYIKSTCLVRSKPRASTRCPETRR